MKRPLWKVYDCIQCGHEVRRDKGVNSNDAYCDDCAPIRSSQSDEQINIDIAKSVGWDFDPIEAREWCSKGKWVKPPEGELVFIHNIPHYTTDLNAIHEVEMMISEKQKISYLRELTALPNYGRLASAEQRAEAYLRTINK